MGLGGTTKRFARTCVDAIRDAGYFDKGRWIDAPPITFDFKAGVQPAPPEMIQRLPEGSRAEGAKVIFPEPSAPALRTAKSGDIGHNADRLTIDGQQYEVALVEPWRQHTRYGVTRFGQ